MLDFLFNLFKRRKHFNDEKQAQFVDAIATMLEVQLATVGHPSLESPRREINKNAIGYIYGFIDAALRTIGIDMSDASVGIPVTFQVLRRLFPKHEEKYLVFLKDHMGTDEAVTLGAMKGGQQYLDFISRKINAPMGLAKYLLPANTTKTTAEAVAEARDTLDIIFNPTRRKYTSSHG